MNNHKDSAPDQDKKKVNVDDDISITYWCKHFACTPEQLKLAVKQVGTSPEAVEEYLKL
ncbi:MAG: DUF3606 domain-containing protein [Bacteroidota bacterium]|nr:DUF3606 domain-containing protein [Bacteroidota bacterium]